ncbi:Putative histone-lysine N-methyltransferase 1 [Frankliniella fusca]|uniref:Histone-lysine N-methyltransferase 1 n=1 Tax=Frankliniella fusca TaxID=407009 RepID=A0AAE1GVQ6_9NEOP|nr:Putative histone-lysine N-methyltransferase 1 [Frankliniella fusca]
MNDFIHDEDDKVWQAEMKLTEVGTLRFESKHTFFKRTARVVRNFKYILYSFAMKHELLQCYLRSGADLRLDVKPSGCSTLIISNCATAIQVAIKASFDSCTHIQECAKISIKGT